MTEIPLKSRPLPDDLSPTFHRLPNANKRLMLFESLAILDPSLLRVNRLFDLKFPMKLCFTLIVNTINVVTVSVYI